MDFVQPVIDQIGTIINRVVGNNNNNNMVSDDFTWLTSTCTPK